MTTAPYRLASALNGSMAVSSLPSGRSLSSGAGTLSFKRDDATGLYRISSGLGSGAAAGLDETDGSEQQLWRLSDCAWGYTVTSVSGLVLDDRYCETRKGIIVWLYEPNGSAAQAWRLSS